MRLRCALIIVLLSGISSLSAQINTVPDFPNKLSSSIQKKSVQLQEQLSRQTEKYLQRLVKKEVKLKRQLSKIDSTATKNLFESSTEHYARLVKKANDTAANIESASGEYMPYVDSLKGALSFLQQDNSLVSSSDAKDKLANSLAQVNQLQSKLQQSEAIKSFVRERKQQINDVLSRYTNLPKSVFKTYNDFNKEFYYYSQQVQEYKELLNDPDKLQQKALSLLNKLPAFQQFMQEHGQLAGLFGLPGDYGSMASLGGLQTRDAVQQLIQNQIAAGGPNASQVLQQNIQGAQAELNKLKDKISQLGGGSGDIEMPQGKVNNQKTKSFKDRLELGTNFQTQRSSLFYPTTSDVGVSLGYRLSNKSTMGLGGSGKIGFGKDIQHVKLTGEGFSLRSFFDCRMKGSFYASAAFEYNYQQLAEPDGVTDPAWKPSGLVGVSKIISLRSKLFQKTKVQLLWDFLSYQQIPRTQALKFRVGYALK